MESTAFSASAFVPRSDRRRTGRIGRLRPPYFIPLRPLSSTELLGIAAGAASRGATST